LVAGFIHLLIFYLSNSVEQTCYVVVTRQEYLKKNQKRCYQDQNDPLKIHRRLKITGFKLGLALKSPIRKTYLFWIHA
ncbi:MAG: hypothetical protein AB2541_08215, partial [Candidatus Thiodiazotropha sp.]